MKPFEETKTTLTPSEKVRVAVAVLIDGWDQQRVATLMGVPLDRVVEAVSAVKAAAETEIEASDFERRLRSRAAGLSAVRRATDEPEGNGGDAG
jgi:hypothetical protein